MVIKDNSLVIKSEIGTEAAWRGFSTQTMYIANRLLIAEDGLKLFPEHIEDLMIMKEGQIIELVQVKNLSSDLSLSDLSPKKEDSFFRRCLKYKSKEDICLKIVSFGEVGYEMDCMLQSEERSNSNIANKLSEYGYDTEDIKWLLKHLTIEKVKESSLENSINNELKKYIETLGAYNLIYDSLIYYIYRLSRVKGSTSKDEWELKIADIAKNIRSIDSIYKQYQKTIIPLHEYKSNETKEQLNKTYKMGVNATPDHIRNNLDIHREKWIKEIEDRFARNNIVLIKGASGQGKSSLAYRYLIDKYPELNVMCIQKVISENHAVEILCALRGLSDRKDIVVYMDVEPYDIQWLWICEKALELGLDIRILISIRQDDFQRSPIDYSKHSFEEISLELTKVEAEEIYAVFNDGSYLSFEEAWDSFGEKGPLMEYIFMLNESKTMVERIEAQIENIIIHEDEADSWLENLAVISLAGMHNNSVSIENLCKRVSCNQRLKMIKYFEKEYFIQVTVNNTYVECLHVLRAKIIFDTLMKKNVFDKERILINTLGVIEHNATQMVVEYVDEIGDVEGLINKLKDINYLSIEVYADVIKALLWCEVNVYSKINSDIIQEGDKLFNNQFMSLGNTDITGLLQTDLSQSIYEIFNKVNPNFEQQMKNQISKLPLLKLQYKFLDDFLEATYKKIFEWFEIKDCDLTPWGYTLFWMAYRNLYLPERTADCITLNTNLDEILNFTLGIGKQKWFNTRNELAKAIIPSILQENKIIYYEITENKVVALMYVDLEEKDEKPHSRLMKMISICQRLFPEKEKYNVKILGYKLLEGVKVSETEKNISKEHLHFVWITQLNRYFLDMQKYYTIPKDWQETFEIIVNARNAVLNYIQIFLKAIEKFYRNESLKIFNGDDYKLKKKRAIEITSTNPYIAPKCAVDKYGIRNDNYVVNREENKYSTKSFMETDKQHISSLSHDYFSYLHAFCENAEVLLIDAKEKNERSQKSRIAYFNLIQALNKVKVFQNKFDNYFSAIGRFENNEIEISELEKMASVCTHIFYHDFVREKSICYMAKENMRVTERKMERFITEGLRLLPGVISVEGEKKAPIVYVNMYMMEDFLLQFFCQTKELAQEVDSVSFSGYLLTKQFQNLCITPVCDDEEVFSNINIPVRNLLLYSEYDKFCSTILPDGEGKKTQIVNNSQAVFQGLGAISSLRMIFRYAAEIERELMDRDIQHTVEDIYKSFQHKVENLLNEALELFRNSCEFIYSNALTDAKQLSEVKIELCEICNKMCRAVFDVVKESSDDEISTFFDSFTTQYCNYVDSAGAVMVDK